MAARMMKPLTFQEVRARIAKAPAAEQPGLIEIAWSCYDSGITGGLAGQARLANPYEPMLPQADQVAVKPKGKAR